MGQPQPRFRLFSVFSNKHYKFLQKIYVKKIPSSIQCRDTNPRPLKREYPPITTRPGLPPKPMELFTQIKRSHWLVTYITSPFNSKLGCFLKMKLIDYFTKSSLSFGWMGMLLSRPVTPPHLGKDLHSFRVMANLYIIISESCWKN